MFLSPSTVEVPENATAGSPVLTVTAHDRDVTQSGHFLFFLGSSASGKFAINDSSGEVTVTAPFDRRVRKDYDVTITVSDNSAPPKMNSSVLHVVITDSNSAPYFVNSSDVSVSQYAFSVNETLAVGLVFGRVKALDQDSGSSGQVRYSIQSGDDLGKFELHPTTGELSLRQRLDFEERKSYRWGYSFRMLQFGCLFLFLFAIIICLFVCLFVVSHPDMTFAVDWALKNNDLSILLACLCFIVALVLLKYF